jgi:hypothetical protein
MAATQTVDERARLRNSAPLQVSKHGVLTLYFYGIQIRVDHGHLAIEGGIGSERYFARLPRVGHGLRRLVVVGNDGVVSLAALRWLADQDAAFVMLERDGKILATTGPVSPSDARLRRAQALATQSGIALNIVRELIDKKIAAQEQVAREKLRDLTVAQAVGEFRKSLARAETIHEIHMLESAAAAAYWLGWLDGMSDEFKSVVRAILAHRKIVGGHLPLIAGVPSERVTHILNYMREVPYVRRIETQQPGKMTVHWEIVPGFQRALEELLYASD